MAAFWRGPRRASVLHAASPPSLGLCFPSVLCYIDQASTPEPPRSSLEDTSPQFRRRPTPKSSSKAKSLTRGSVGARPRPRLSATTRRRRPRRRHRRPETWPRPYAARARTPPPRRRRRRTRTPSRATRCCRALCRPRQVPPFLRTRHTYLSHNYSKNQRFCAARSIAGASTSSARSRRFRAGEASAQAARRVPSRPSHAAADAASGGRASSGIAR